LVKTKDRIANLSTLAAANGYVRSSSHPIYGSLDSRESTPKNGISIQPFLHSTSTWPKQRHRYTDHATCDINRNTPHYAIHAMRPENWNTKPGCSEETVRVIIGVQPVRLSASFYSVIALPCDAPTIARRVTKWTGYWTLDISRPAGALGRRRIPDHDHYNAHSYTTVPVVI